MHTPIRIVAQFIDWCGCSTTGTDQGQAFSRCPLHAAAPQLLEALKNIQLEADEATDGADNPYNVLESIDKLARAAIQAAKETG